MLGAIAGIATVAATGAAGGRGTVAECAGLLDRRLEVCTAYISNSTLAARVPYYKFARSANPARARLARYRFESRYVGSARSKIEQQVAGWPRGDADVDLPRISVLAVNVAGDRATLVTRETWRVETSAGRALFVEARKRHTVEMRRVAGLALHKWVVFTIR